jgi:hypothetical protein
LNGTAAQSLSGIISSGHEAVPEDAPAKIVGLEMRFPLDRSGGIGEVSRPYLAGRNIGITGMMLISRNASHLTHSTLIGGDAEHVE